MASTSPPANPPRLTFGKLVLRSLRFHARAHLGVVLGAMVGSAALIGALVVGDSVRGSLRDRALERLGETRYALTLPDRFVTEGLAQRMPAGLRDSWHPDPNTLASYMTKPAMALTLPALASRQDQSARANRVNLIGVDYEHEAGQRNDLTSFWDLAPNHQPIEIPPGEVWLNETLSAQLNAKPGDTLIFRVHKPSALSRETPITPRADTSVALRLRVAGIRDAAGLGNFSLRASQTPPFNAFMNLGELQRATALEEKVNVLVSAGVMLAKTKDPSLTANLLRKIGLAKWAGQLNQGKWAYQSTSETLKDFARDLKAHVRLEDFQAAVRPASGNAIELFSRRIFLEPQLAQAATAGTNAQPILTYLVNVLRHDERTAPYSMVTAAGAPWTPTDMRDDEILFNDWLAADLRAKPGDTVELSYYVVDAGSQLLERTNRFRVRAVVPLSGLYADRTLMPEFPGLAKAESTHDWDAGFPLVHKIRDEDEAYWKQNRGTPKAFITLTAGQKMWSNRFGSLTAIRFPIPTGLPVENATRALEAKMTAAIDPAQLGLRFEPVREQALASVSQAQDFGKLFLGFSFFVILAALILMALLFQFGLEQRTAEIGTLLALGFTPKQVRHLLLSEGTLLALLGGILGMAGGIFYARAMLHGLTTLWRDAVGTSALHYHATPTTLLIGLLSSVVVSAITIALVLRKQARRPARELLAEGLESESSDLKSRRTSKGKWIALPAGLSALAIVGWALRGGETAAAGAFFGAGALLLVTGLGIVAMLFAALGNSNAANRISLTGMGLRSCTRQRKRSLATVALLACGSFLVIAVAANKLDANMNAEKRSSGTGGFALFGESTLPVVHDLNSPAGRDFFGLDADTMQGVSVVTLRVRDGDDASCLNLNRAQNPRLLGVKPEFLQSRGAFTFAKIASGLSPKQPWLLLQRRNGDEPVPALADQNSILWAMGKKVGDTLDYTDERGRPFKIRLVGGVANSILQGNLLIDEAEFVSRFPGESGYRMFLIDAPSNTVTQVSAALSRALQDVGLELTPAAQRLAAFNAVQNTYLNTFQILGGLGLLLGSAGLGVVVLRNVLERRGELALLQAVGFRRRSLQWLVMSEHGALLWLGLGVGVGAAVLAILPALRTPGAEIPFASLGITLGLVLVSGMVWTWVATWLALRGKLLDALRSE